MQALSERAQQFKSAIKTFIDERREAKFKGKEPDAEAASRYEYNTWLADAASRAKHLQSVTHVAKATHPSAKGSNIFAIPSALPRHSEIGTHSLGIDFAEDTAIDNAKHLDVFSFLNVEVFGESIMNWSRQNDPDFLTALSTDETRAMEWVQSFNSLTCQEEALSAHFLMKQIYWLVGNDPNDDGCYQILEPLFSSSFEQRIHAELEDSLWSEQSSATRKAKNKGLPSEAIYQSYPNVAVRKLGGSNTQNVSRLNNTRRGKNYLLASLPPRGWEKGRAPTFLHIDSSLNYFGYSKGVQKLIRKLAAFLRSDPPANVQTRNHREVLEQKIGLELPVFAANIRAQQAAGWTRDTGCELARCEQLWLDSDRAELPLREGHEAEDKAFIDEYHWGDWPDEVAGRFANWLNARLSDAGVKGLGSTEYKHWARQAIVESQWPVPMKRRPPEVAE